MKNTIAIATVLMALAAPAAAIAAPAKLSRADANASARSAAVEAAHGLEQLGYHAVSAKLDHAERLGPRRFGTVFGLVATATRAGANDGICLLTVYTWRTGHRVVSQSNSLTCTNLF